MDLVTTALEGNRLSLARLLTRLRTHTEGRLALDALYPHTGGAHLIRSHRRAGRASHPWSTSWRGCTAILRNGRKRLARGVVAVDPSSRSLAALSWENRVRMRGPGW